MIKFADLTLKDKDIQQVIIDVLESGWFINGPYNEEFSKLWASRCYAFNCINTASGMAALIATLKALKEMSDSRVHHIIVPTYSFAATVFAVTEAGCIPVYCSVDENGLINQEECFDLLNRIDVLGVIPVHLYGQYLKIDERILNKTFVIEDACQVHGALDRIQGLAACFSFYPSKNLGAAGDAGCIVTNHNFIASKTREYINYGDPPGKKYIHRTKGNNLRMDEIQAAILVKKLQDYYLDSDNARRKEIAELYHSNGIETIATLKPNVYHLYPIFVSDPEKCKKLFLDNQIEVGTHYPYRLPDICPGLDYSTRFKNDKSEFITKHVLTLPMSPHLTDEEVLQVALTLKKLCKFDGKLWHLEQV